MTCCERFGAFHADPAAFFDAEVELDQDRHSRSRDGERRVTVTARGLVLTRDLCVQHGREEIYDAERGSHRLPDWGHDTCLHGLGLDAGALLAMDGERVLDVASGLAIFGTEMSALGAQVDCVDLEIDDAHPSFALVADIVRRRYAEQLELLSCLARHADHARYTMTTEELALLERLTEAAPRVARDYPKVSGERIQDDATSLSKLPDDVYDIATCGWLMVHLEPTDERRTIANMLRVTKPGGRVHIRAGYGGELAERVRSWFGDCTIARAADDLVVLLA